MDFQDLQVKVSYLNPDDLDWVERAYHVAAEAHQGQYRLSGEPYIIHPLEVASIIAGLQLDRESLCAALLHDILEDTPVTAADLTQIFGDEITSLVAGLTKLKGINFNSIVDHQVENYRNFFIATAKDPRVMLIKLADRVHNMRTLEHHTPEKQLENARETMTIYAPLAGRIGVQIFKAELEDLSLKYQEPEAYRYLVEQIESRRADLQERLDGYVTLFERGLRDMQVSARVYGRIKHYYSIYRKMVGKSLDLDEVYDLLALRVITEDIVSCYTALAIAHNAGMMLPFRFQDFINMPKSNGYRSLHTTIVIGDHENLEVQIRTEEMHDIAERGVATHWAYKEKENAAPRSLTLANIMREMLEIGESVDGVEFLNELKMEHFDDEIRVYTPTFDLITLPRDATPIDFAYRVHTEVGHRCIGARINGRIAPIDSRLNNGDRVEIMTTKQSSRGPSADWLKFVRTRNARERIRTWLRTARREENIVAGEEALTRELRRLGHEQQLQQESIRDAVMERYQKAAWDDLLETIGFGRQTATSVAQFMIETWRRGQPQELPSTEELLAEVLLDKPRQPRDGIVIDQLDGLVYRLARCCNPIPGDRIVGYVTRGRGVTIHREGCVILKNEDQERLIPASWGNNLLKSFAAPLQVQALNRPNLLQLILLQVQDTHTVLHSVNARSNRNEIATIDMLVEVSSMEQLHALQERIRRMKDIFSVDLPVR